MNYLVFYADNSSYQFEKRFNGASAFERALSWAGSVPDCKGIAVFSPLKVERAVSGELVQMSLSSVEIITEPQWTAKKFVTELAAWARDKEAASIIFALSSSPFYDIELTKELLAHHKKYASEYTFAEGYAEGLVPAVIDSGALKSLAELAKNIPDNPNMTSRALFEVMKSRVNSFEVETLIAPHDLRFYRFDFSCVTKRALLACERLFEKSLERGMNPGASFADELGVLAKDSPEVQRTVPSFYAVQISCFTNDNPVYSPYDASYRKKFSHAPNEAREKNPACFMPLDSFKKLAAEAAEFSGEAVISLSAWGEALAHPHIESIIEAALAYPGLSLLIETDGSLVTRELIQTIKEIADKSPARENGHEKIYWIVSIDAVDKTMYEKMRPGAAMSFDRAVAADTILKEYFGGAVYSQFTRTTINEEQLESFYRNYKEKGNLIIQKYDHYCKTLPDLRPADLSPVDRFPCWHIVRDMIILTDGSVVMCKEQALDSISNINAITDGIKSAWEKIAEIANKSDPALVMPHGCCKDCDEYYTFNF